MCHQSGIRHYKLKDPTDKKKDEDKDTAESKENDKEKSDSDTELKKDNENDEKIIASDEGKKANDVDESRNVKVNYLKEKRRKMRRLLNKARVKKRDKDEESEFDLSEYYIKEQFDTVEEAMKIFEDDDLFFKPG